MKSRVSPAMIGSFVVSGIVLVVLFVIVMGGGRLFNKRETFVAFFPGSVGGLTVGSNVSFRGVNVGSVREVLLFMGDDTTALGPEDYRIPVVFDLDETLLRSRGSSLDLSDPTVVQGLLDDGMSARLDTESLLTGRLYVSLDYRPDADPAFFGGNLEYPEIPTVPSSMSEIQDQFRELAERFSTVNLEEVFTALRSSLDGINELVTDEDLQAVGTSVNRLVLAVEETVGSVQDLVVSVDTAVGPVGARFSEAADEAEVSMREINETMDALQAVLQPGSPVVHNLATTLEELERAARSLRRVAELIDRDPSILVRGRATGGGS